MYKCFICQALHAPCQSLITHLRIDHSFYPSTRYKLVCAQYRCRRQFSTFSGFKKHLISVHEKDCFNSADAESSEPSQVHFNNPQDAELAGISAMQSQETLCFEDNSLGQRKKEENKDICASIIAKLQGSGLANSVVSTIVSDLEEFATGLHSQVKNKMISLVPKDDPLRSALQKHTEHFENPFISFNTETKRTKYFSEKWGIVEPEENILGLRYDTRPNKKTGTYDQVPVKDTFVYIPILETITFMCRNSDICKLLEKSHVSKAGQYEDFCDGTYFKTHPLFSKQQTSLQIQIY